MAMGKMNSWLAVGLSTVLSLAFTVAPAQDKGYMGFVEGGYSALMAGKKGDVVSFSTTHGYLFRHFYLGGGIGIDHYSVHNSKYSPEKADMVSRYEAPGYSVRKFSGWAVPVYVDMKGVFCSGRWSPLLEARGGLSLGYVIGTFAEAGAGVMYRLGGKFALHLKCYSRYAYEPSFIVTDDFPDKEGGFFSVGVRLGFSF